MNPAMTDCVIFDIDGTLADLSHRLHFLEGKRRDYEGFYGALGDDAPINPVIALLKTILCGDGDVVLVSGRPDNYRRETQEWLKIHGLYNLPLYMRKAGDHRPDHAIKHEILAQLREDGWNPWLVIEDRPKVVAMWREEGLVCLQNAYRERIG